MPLKNKSFSLYLCLLPCLLFVINLVVKLLYSTKVQIGHDEPYTIWHAQMPLALMLNDLRQTDVNPPFYQIFLHYWVLVFGSSPFSVRFPSVLFVSFSSVLVYQIGRKTFSWQTGIIAALLFSMSNQFVYFAHEARSYALLSLLGLLSIYFCMLWKDGNKGAFPFLVLINTLMIHTHYFGFFLILSQLIWVIGFHRSNKGKIVFILGLMISGILFIPQFLVFLTHVPNLRKGHWCELTSWNGFYTIIAKYCNQPVPTVIMLLAFLVGMTGILSSRIKKNISSNYHIFLLIIFPLCYFLISLIGLKVRIYHDKYLSICFPAFFILVTGLVEWRFSKIPRYIFWVALLLSMAFTTKLSVDKRSHWREVAYFTKLQYRSGDLILISPGSNHLSFIYYFDRAIFDDWENIQSRMLDQHIISLSAETKYLPLDIKRMNSVFFIDVGNQPLNTYPEINDTITSHFQLNDINNNFHGIKVLSYKKELVDS